MQSDRLPEQEFDSIGATIIIERAQRGAYQSFMIRYPIALFNYRGADFEQPSSPPGMDLRDGSP